MGDTDMAAERYGYAAENGGTMRWRAEGARMARGA